MITFIDSLLNHSLQNFVDAVNLVCLEYERYYLNDWVGCDEDNHQIGCFASASANIVYSLTTVPIIFRTKLICCDVDSSVSFL